MSSVFLFVFSPFQVVVVVVVILSVLFFLSVSIFFASSELDDYSELFLWANECILRCETVRRFNDRGFFKSFFLILREIDLESCVYFARTGCVFKTRRFLRIAFQSVVLGRHQDWIVPGEREREKRNKMQLGSNKIERDQKKVHKVMPAARIMFWY